MADESPGYLSIVIMAFNEGATIRRQAMDSLNFLDRHVPGGSGEVIIVDDGSADDTGRIADELALSDARVRVVHHGTNRGMGAAIASGYGAASCRFVTQLPGDAQVHPETLARFLPLLESHDLVLSEYEKRGDGPLRAFITWGYQTTALLLLKNRCAFTGTMVFRRSLIEGMPIRSRTFMANVEVPLRMLRAGVAPGMVTISCVARQAGRSKVLSVRRILRVILEMMALRRELVLS
ncbi:MAG TPA: glycosyltransferase family 2 protein [Myxococcota bacterium]|nr:glycosyltransferase family 2 protein [Myxococcota bacterium]HOH77230.1 glycosyltransferase family 2 protein [Myxococcota bacterium]